MPCYDGMDTRVDKEYLGDLQRAEAVLCAILSASDDPIKLINSIDEKESGVTKAWISAWWERHQRKDVDKRTFFSALGFSGTGDKF